MYILSETSVFSLYSSDICSAQFPKTKASPSHIAALDLYSAFSLLNCSTTLARELPFVLRYPSTSFATSAFLIALKPIARLSKSEFKIKLYAVLAASLPSITQFAASSAFTKSALVLLSSVSRYLNNDFLHLLINI